MAAPAQPYYPSPPPMAAAPLPPAPARNPAEMLAALPESQRQVLAHVLKMTPEQVGLRSALLGGLRALTARCVAADCTAAPRRAGASARAACAWLLARLRIARAPP